MTRPVRIANASAGYGDRFEAPRQMVEGGPIDVLTGDYLAELTMWILWRARQRDPEAGYATTFVGQMEAVLGTAVDRGVKIVTNAGGLNPAALAAALRRLADRLGVPARVMHLEGDDLLGDLDDLRRRGHRLTNLDTGRHLTDDPVTANAYLGAWGIVEALGRGADVVVCGRVTDAALTVGPAAWFHGWRRDDWDRLAAATVAGHVLECGTQATGGNYAFFSTLPGALPAPGFPLVEIAADGTAEVTKHPGQPGRVTAGTVTAQLLYELGGPRYLTPDVTARFDTVELADLGDDRVRVTGVRGEPPPPTTKVAVTYQGGYRNTMTCVLVGLEVEAKARAALDGLAEGWGGTDRFDELSVRLVRADRDDPADLEEALAYLTVTVKGSDPDIVGRAFSDAFVQMGLATYPGYHLTSPPSRASPYGVYWPTVVPNGEVSQVLVDDAGRRVPIAPAPGTATPPAESPPEPDGVPVPGGPTPGGPTRRVPLGSVFGARSGDKGGTANVGVWAPGPEAYAWLAGELTVEAFRSLVPRAASLDVARFAFPRIHALNFVVKGLLGDGVSANADFDPQAKALGEFLRARHVALPETLLAGPADWGS